MIEFEGWIFDFENMDGLDPQGRPFAMKAMNGAFYYQCGAQWYGEFTPWPNYSSWIYVGRSYECAKQVYRLYEEFLIEEVLFNEY